MSASNGRVTLAVLQKGQDNILDILQELKEEFKEHVKLNLETKTEVTKLSTIEEGRRWHFRTIWGSILALAGAVFVKWVM